MQDTAADQALAAHDPLSLYGTQVDSRLLLGTALYPSPDIMARSVKASGCGIVTVSLRRESARHGAGNKFWDIIQGLGVRVLPTPPAAGRSRRPSPRRRWRARYSAHRG